VRGDPGVVVSRAAESLASCPFCGQPLLNKQAAEHLQHQVATYEATQAAEVEAEVRKQFADADRKERDRRDQVFSTRERQLALTLKKLQEQNSELSRRVERLSAGDRGEINEDEIVSRLTRAFPDDDFRRTRRGQRGADIFQRVRFRTGGDLTEAGLIIYECKDTLRWNNRFITQMKGQAKLHATPYAVLVSRCFPPGLKSLVVVDEIVVVDPARAAPLAEIMRRMVIESYRTGAVAGSQAAKTTELFRFISSTKFGQAFDTLAESVEALDGLLNRERQSHQKIWTERGQLYQNVNDTVIAIDQRFKAILEGKAKERSVRVLAHERASA
jgi:hypothetical protein